MTLFLGLWQPVLWGKGLLVESHVDVESVELGDTFTLEVVIQTQDMGSDPDYQAPNFEGIEVLRRGTQRGQSISMGFGSGPRVQSTLTFTYVLRATAVPLAKIGRAQVSLGKESAQTEPIVIRVTPASQNQPQAPPSTGAPMQALPPQVLGKNHKKEEVLLKVVPSKTQAYVGEQIILSLFVLSRFDLVDFQNFSQPQFSSALVERDDRPRKSIQRRIQKINGVEYQVYEVARYFMFPLQSGDIRVGEFGLTVVSLSGMSFFFDGGSYALKSAPLEIHVAALPDKDKPKGFSQLNVGQLAFSAQLSSQHVFVGQPVTLELLAKGNASMNKVQLPALTLNQDGLKLFDPELQYEKSYEQGALLGEVKQKTLIMPSQAGQYTIPTLLFDYFNPEDGRYHRIETPSMSLTVSQPKNAATGSVSVAPTTKPLQNSVQNTPAKTTASENLAPNVKFIPMTVSGLQSEFVREPTTLWWVLIVGSLLSVFVLLFLHPLFVRLKSKWLKPESPMAQAKKSLHQSSLQLDQDPRVIYSQVHKILQDYLHARFGLSYGASHYDITNVLKNKHKTETCIESLLAELENLDFARFAPTHHQQLAAGQTIERVMQLIKQLDKI